MAVINESAPCNKDPEFNRGSFLRAPDWRWQEAQKLAMSDIDSRACIVTVQPVILFAARIQRACRNPASRQFIRAKYPQAWEVMSLGRMDNGSNLKSALQACIIYGLSAQKISQKLKWIKPLQAQLYMDLFCDLTGVQGIAQWFQQMLLQPARHAKSMNLFRARALAHYYSLQSALQSLRFGNMGSSAKKAMQAMWRDARSRQLFDYMAQNLNVPIQIYVTSMQQALKSRQEHEFILQNKQEGAQAQEGLLDIVANSLDASVRTYTQVQISASNGADPSNDIIQKITDKEKA